MGIKAGRIIWNASDFEGHTVTVLSVPFSDDRTRSFASQQYVTVTDGVQRDAIRYLYSGDFECLDIACDVGCMHVRALQTANEAVKAYR